MYSLLLCSSDVTWQRIVGKDNFTPLKKGLSQTLEVLYQQYLSLLKSNAKAAQSKIVSDPVEVRSSMITEILLPLAYISAVIIAPCQIHSCL
jgi:hypothetical protein